MLTAWLLLRDGTKTRIDEGMSLHLLIIGLKFGPYRNAIGRIWITKGM